MNLSELKTAVKLDHFKVTLHALQEKEFDNISIHEIKESLQSAELIETYSYDKPFPSCLLLGFNNRGEPIHSVWAYNKESKSAILITVYKPNPGKWIEYRKRK